VSGAADREQPCGLVVMDGWRRELFAFWVFGTKPMNRRRGAPGAGGLVGRVELRRGRSVPQTSAIGASSRYLTFFGTEFRAPRAVDACSTGARGAITTQRVVAYQWKGADLCSP